MKKTIVSTLALLAVLSIAGIAFAAQPAAPAEEAAVATVAPAAEAAPAPVVLEDDLFAPIEVNGGCCYAECFETFNTCRAACNGDFSCIAQCRQEKEACESHC